LKNRGITTFCPPSYRTLTRSADCHAQKARCPVLSCPALPSGKFPPTYHLKKKIGKIAQLSTKWLPLVAGGMNPTDKHHAAIIDLKVITSYRHVLLTSTMHYGAGEGWGIDRPMDSSISAAFKRRLSIRLFFFVVVIRRVFRHGESRLRRCCRYQNETSQSILTIDVSVLSLIARYTLQEM
jgi:hypothetical protein